MYSDRDLPTNKAWAGLTTDYDIRAQKKPVWIANKVQFLRIELCLVQEETSFYLESALLVL